MSKNKVRGVTSPPTIYVIIRWGDNDRLNLSYTLLTKISKLPRLLDKLFQKPVIIIKSNSIRCGLFKDHYLEITNYAKHNYHE